MNLWKLFGCECLGLSRKDGRTSSCPVQEVSLDFSNKKLGNYTSESGATEVISSSSLSKQIPRTISHTSSSATSMAPSTIGSRAVSSIRRSIVPNIPSMPSINLPPSPKPGRDRMSKCKSPTPSVKRSLLSINTRASFAWEKKPQVIESETADEAEDGETPRQRTYSDDPFAPPTPGVVGTYRTTSQSGASRISNSIISPRTSQAYSVDNSITASPSSTANTSAGVGIPNVQNEKVRLPHERLPSIRILPSLDVDEITSPTLPSNRRSANHTYSICSNPETDTQTQTLTLTHEAEDTTSVICHSTLVHRANSVGQSAKFLSFQAAMEKNSVPFP